MRGYSIELLVVVNVSELGVSVLSKHQGGLHEGRSSRLASQAEVQQRSIVKICLGVPAHSSVQLLLIGKDGVWRGIVGFDV